MILLFRPRVTVSSKNLKFLFVHLVYNSALFLVLCCCSFLLYVLANLICIVLVSRQLVLLSAFPEFLNSFCGQKRVYPPILLKHFISTDVNRVSRILSFFLRVQISLPYKRMGTASTLYTFIPLIDLQDTHCLKYHRTKIFQIYY